MNVSFVTTDCLLFLKTFNQWTFIYMYGGYHECYAHNLDLYV